MNRVDAGLLPVAVVIGHLLELRTIHVHVAVLADGVGDVTKEIQRELFVVAHELVHRIGGRVPLIQRCPPGLLEVVPLAVADHGHGVLGPHHHVLDALRELAGVHAYLRRHLPQPERRNAEPKVNGTDDAQGIDVLYGVLLASHLHVQVHVAERLHLHRHPLEGGGHHLDDILVRGRAFDGLDTHTALGVRLHGQEDLILPVLELVPKDGLLLEVAGVAEQVEGLLGVERGELAFADVHHLLEEGRLRGVAEREIHHRQVPVLDVGHVYPPAAEGGEKGQHQCEQVASHGRGD